MSDALKKFIDTIPKVLKPGTNPVLYALLLAIAQQDDELQIQTQNAKDQDFIRTAGGQALDKAAASLGVSRPATLGLQDSDFQELIPNLSLKPKQIKKAFYDTSDIFWGPLFSRANITSNNIAPFNVSPGDSFKISVDNGDTQEIKALSTDIALPGSATAEEILNILSRIRGATTIILTDSLTGNQSINIRTNTPGSVGGLEIFDSSMVGTSKLDFDLKKVDILDLPQRVSVYNISPNELLIEIPAIVPALRRTLKGSHHFHQDGTLEPPQPPDQGIWAGSFFYNPSGSAGTFTISNQKAVLQQTINKGQVYTSIVVDDTTLFENPSGEIIFSFGMEDQEVPVKYRGIPNGNTILLDPSYTFTKDHASGTVINVITKRAPYIPRRNGIDLAIYLTSPSGARIIVQAILQKLKAAGIILKFIVLAPKYKYIIDNPYLPEDDAPSSS